MALAHSSREWRANRSSVAIILFFRPFLLVSKYLSLEKGKTCTSKGCSVTTVLRLLDLGVPQRHLMTHATCFQEQLQKRPTHLLDNQLWK